MSIERVSRYNDGTLAQVPYEHTGSYQISVYRKWPEKVTVKYTEHIWKYGDTLANIANTYLGGSKYWWEIMDINPEIIDPFNIDPGTVIRVPNGV